MAPHNNDPFDDLLTLEDTLYTTAHDQGVADGARAGRIEGRIFGLERGFEKFAALGELHGRGAVWGSRIPTTASTTPNPEDETTADSTSTPSTPLPPLTTTSTRLLSNITLLYHLTDPPTFSTANTETSVADFDDRFKRAGAKAKVVERIVGETLTSGSTTTDAKSPERSTGAAKGRNVRLEGDGKRGGKKGDDNMEDFGGSRLIG
ncbi:hypothetical protein EKO04_008448 [Ascochyta lentis]|uniref:Essential protein Yae1 N-terminal domain-containing protein n=1 Tax=Ascochyta lentis TaxID=205686 RepID=A0A8H7IZH7_9PLEO|nr:hypothetical protein EKO04_008448 [Ascochyta lentis]